MGTPHRGSNVANWTNYFAGLLRLANGEKATNIELLDALKPNSRVLSQISESFVERATALNIYSFYELEKYWGSLVRVSFL